MFALAFQLLKVSIWSNPGGYTGFHGCCLQMSNFDIGQHHRRIYMGPIVVCTLPRGAPFPSVALHKSGLHFIYMAPPRTKHPSPPSIDPSIHPWYSLDSSLKCFGSLTAFAGIFFFAGIGAKILCSRKNTFHAFVFQWTQIFHSLSALINVFCG